MFDPLFLTHFHFQPAEFNQLEHEKRFKLIFKGLTTVITVYAVSYRILAHFIESENFSNSVPLLTGVDPSQVYGVGMAMRLYLLMRIDAHQMRIICINCIK